jgi:hypothetical protein
MKQHYRSKRNFYSNHPTLSFPLVQMADHPTMSGIGRWLEDSFVRTSPTTGYAPVSPIHYTASTSYTSKAFNSFTLQPRLLLPLQPLLLLLYSLSFFYHSLFFFYFTAFTCFTFTASTSFTSTPTWCLSTFQCPSGAASKRVQHVTVSQFYPFSLASTFFYLFNLSFLYVPMYLYSLYFFCHYSCTHFTHIAAPPFAWSISTSFTCAVQPSLILHR